MQKLLIAVRAQLLADALEAALPSRFAIHRCSSDADVCSWIGQLRPEALIVDLRLSGGAGFSVSEVCRYKPAAVVALTDLINDEVMQAADGAGVGALVPLPCSAGHVAEILDLLTTKTPSPEG